MNHYLFDPMMQFLMFLVGAGSVCGPITAYVFLRHKRALIELELKRELASRGMSSEEICEVVRCSSRHGSPREPIVEARLI